MANTSFDFDVVIDGDNDVHFYGEFLPSLFRAAKNNGVLISVATWRGQGGGWPTFTLSGEKGAIANTLEGTYGPSDAKYLIELL